MLTEPGLRKTVLLSSVNSRIICSFPKNRSFSTALCRGFLPITYSTTSLVTSSGLDIHLFCFFFHSEMEHLSRDIHKQNTKKAYTYCCQNDKSVCWPAEQSATRTKAVRPLIDEASWVRIQLCQRSGGSRKNLEFVSSWALWRFVSCNFELTSPKFPLDCRAFVLFQILWVRRVTCSLFPVMLSPAAVLPYFCSALEIFGL